MVETNSIQFDADHGAFPFELKVVKVQERLRSSLPPSPNSKLAETAPFENAPRADEEQEFDLTNQLIFEMPEFGESVSPILRGRTPIMKDSPPPERVKPKEPEPAEEETDLTKDLLFLQLEPEAEDDEEDEPNLNIEEEFPDEQFEERIDSSPVEADEAIQPRFAAKPESPTDKYCLNNRKPSKEDVAEIFSFKAPSPNLSGLITDFTEADSPLSNPAFFKTTRSSGQKFELKVSNTGKKKENKLKSSLADPFSKS